MFKYIDQIIRLRQILDMLEMLDSPTAESMGELSGQAERTVRTRINQLQSLGARIELTSVAGHRLWVLRNDFDLPKALSNIASRPAPSVFYPEEQQGELNRLRGECRPRAKRGKVKIKS